MPKLTPAQTWLVHTLEALFLSAIVAGSLAGYQDVATGNYGLTAIGGVVLAAAVAVLAKGASTSILGNANLLPAILDTVKDIQAAGSTQPTVAPVVIHNYPATPAPDVPITEQPTKQVSAVKANTPPKAG
jgi:hypothetical protein